MITSPKTPTRILVGGNTSIPGWTTINADPSTHPDIVSDIQTLDGIPPKSIFVLYASHVFEHIELRHAIGTLTRIGEVMRPGGTVFLSVPDLSELLQLLQDPRLDVSQKLHVARMIYGGQTTQFDYHYFGYTFEILSALLASTGFVNVRKVERFGIHNDTSNFSPYFHRNISLNVVCHRREHDTR